MPVLEVEGYLLLYTKCPEPAVLTYDGRQYRLLGAALLPELAELPPPVPEMDCGYRYLVEYYAIPDWLPGPRSGVKTVYILGVL